jgi:iron complex outermembrane receptor protein
MRAAAFAGLCWTLVASGRAYADPEPSASEVTAADYGVSLEDLLNIKVVTAGAKEERGLASANVFIVTRADIEHYGYRSLTEILANVPGLYVIDDFMTPSVSVRGISGGLGGGTRIVRMMIDGVQVNFRPDLTAFLGPEYIPAEAIERVEVAKGPLSALYGANAFLATVNVITRSPGSGLGSELAAHYGHNGHAGSPGASGLVSFKEGRTSFLAAFSSDRVNRSGVELQQTFPAQSNSPQLFGRTSDGDYARPSGAYAKLETGSDKLGTLSVAGGVQQMDSMGEFRINSLLTHRNRLAIQNVWSNLRWDRTWSSTKTLAATLGYSQGASTKDTSLYLSESRSSMYRPNYSYRAVTASAFGEWNPGQRLSLRVGFDGELDKQNLPYYTQVFNVPVGSYRADDEVDISIGPNDARTHWMTDIGVYTQIASTPFPARLPGLRLTGNARVDHIAQGDLDFPLQTSWRLAAAYRVTPSLYAKIVGGRAFQAPSSVLTFGRSGFGNVGNIVGSATIAGMSQLRPQTVDSAEAVVSGRLMGVLVLEGGLFFQHVKDRIEFVRYGANYRATNLGSISAVGAEASVRLTVRRFSSYLVGCVQRMIEDGSLVSDAPPSFPNAFGRVGAEMSLPEAHLQANADARLVSARGAEQGNVTVNNGTPYTLPSYMLLNANLSSMGLHLLGQKTETRLLVGVRNILDKRFSEPGYAGFDSPSLGRVYVAELRQVF